MKSIIASITVENCKEALHYYQGIFGGEVRNAQLADNVDMFKGQEGKYIHSELHINEHCVLYIIDILGGAHVAGNNFQLVLEFESETEIINAFNELAKEGTVVFQLQDTFWGAKHGVITDKYGIKWGLNYTKQA